MLTKYIPQKEIELGMNLIILAMALFLLFKQGTRIKETNRNLYTGGVISGFLAGLLGTGGAIRGITLAAFHLEKDAFISTSALIDFGVDFSRAGVYIWNGYVQKEHMIYIPFLIVISLLGTYVGKRLLVYVSEKVFQIILLSIICLTALYQTIHFWM